MHCRLTVNNNAYYPTVKVLCTLHSVWYTYCTHVYYSCHKVTWLCQTGNMHDKRELKKAYVAESFSLFDFYYAICSQTPPPPLSPPVRVRVYVHTYVWSADVHLHMCCAGALLDIAGQALPWLSTVPSLIFLSWSSLASLAFHLLLVPHLKSLRRVEEPAYFAPAKIILCETVCIAVNYYIILFCPIYLSGRFEIDVLKCIASHSYVHLHL